MKKIIIIDYGYGNIFSLISALNHIGCNPIVSKNPEEIITGDIIFLPGVGAFKPAMQELLNLNMDEAILCSIKRGALLIGICLGYQLLFEESEEFGKIDGLGLVKGKVVSLNNYKNGPYRIPNIGWYPIKNVSTNSKFANFLYGELFYFVHSYIPIASNTKIVNSYIKYGNSLLQTSICSDQIMGFQFHPEKSGNIGLKLLDNIIKKYK